MCTHSLRTDFLSAVTSTGGSWTYVGFNETSSTGPFTTNASTPPAALVGAVPLALIGDNPSIDWASADDGYYYFTYDLGSCGGIAELVVHAKELCFTSSLTINVHEDQSEINLNVIAQEGLFCALSKGYWTFVSGELDAFSTPKFFPSIAGAGTTTVLDYIMAGDCTDCKTTLTINVYACTSNDLCYYYTDFSETSTQEDLDNSQILYFKVGGVNQLTTPITGFGPKNVITYGANNFLTNFVDTLNSIGIDCFNFFYSTYVVAPETRQKWMRVCYPQNVDWELKVYSDGGAGGGTFWIYNSSTGISYSYDNVTYYTFFVDGFYNVTSGGTTGIETCITVSSCE